MSFSQTVKDELVDVTAKARHCELAELAALLAMAGKIKSAPDGTCTLKISTENQNVVTKAQLLIHRAFGYESDILVRDNNKEKKEEKEENHHNATYVLSIADREVAVKILQGTRLMDADGYVNEDLSLVNTTGISNSCCKRAYLRGAFCTCGSISDPEKSYHLELVTGSRHKAEQLVEAMRPFELEAHIVERRKNYVVYLKEGSQIVDMLNVMGAHKSLMDLENVRILKEMRNSINRQVNCETANMSKTINAAVKQVEDIRFIQQTAGLGSLKEGLYEIAELRLANPDMPLKELGELLSPPVGKSGVNHRLRKISEIADDLRRTKL